VTDQIIITKPDDFHLHLRQEELLRHVVAYSSAAFARAMVMPNISPPVKDRASLEYYRNEILQAAGNGFTPLMTFKIMPSMTGKCIEEMKTSGVLAGKYYPAGATTNSADALAGWQQCREALETMEALDIPLSIHAEDPDAPALEREQAFLPVLDQIRRFFPNLRIVFEHISSALGAAWVQEQDEKVAATVTLHHLMFTIEDIIGGPLRPHLFCRPLPKTYKDREAIRKMVLSDFPRVFFGSDSAPHLKERKEASGGAAGVFTAPVLMPLLAQFFEEQKALPILENFVSVKGAAFYGLPQNTDKLVLERGQRQVPPICDGVVPLYAGRSLSWKIKDTAL